MNDTATEWLGHVTPFSHWRCEEIYDGRRHVARIYVAGDAPSIELQALCLIVAPYLGAEQRRARVHALRQQVASFIHDFNQPLAAMSLSLSMLRPTGESERQVAARCVRSIHRQRELLDELPYLTGGTQEPRDPILVDEVVAQVVEDAHAHAEVRHVTIVQKTVPAAVVGSKVALRRAFGNVLLNAIELTPEGSTVTVVMQRRRGVVSVEVRDEGRGVAPEERERLFEPFVSHRHGGTGLGLAVARAVAESHGGAVQFVGGPGGRVRFDLPEAGAVQQIPITGIANALPPHNGEDHARERRRGPRVRLQAVARIPRPRRRGGNQR